MWPLYLEVALVGYLLGSIPTGYLVARTRGIDIRQHGSGNIGATNVVRVLGKKPGYFVFFCDALKGFLAVRAAYWLLSSLTELAFGKFRVYHTRPPGQEVETWRDWIEHQSRLMLGSQTPYFDVDYNSLAWHGSVLAIVAALACILGHNFPVWLKFRGGKGVATTIGVLLGLMPLALLIVLPVWLLAFFVGGYVSVASMLAAMALPATIWGLDKFGLLGRGAFWPMFYFSLTAAFLVVWRHRANIQRLLAGTEPRSARKSKTPPAPPEPASLDDDAPSVL